ncbi:MAG: hypothetical protein D3904_17110 [Candidatus Electrothrix sp. EH2]|nr:hypothetical protein [Candidatus Electrothrix sp. EH2]
MPSPSTGPNFLASCYRQLLSLPFSDFTVSCKRFFAVINVYNLNPVNKKEYQKFRNKQAGAARAKPYTIKYHIRTVP